MSKTLCERRTSCALNNGGVCTLAAPRLDRQNADAYVNCLDQVGANGIGSMSIGSGFVIE